MISLRRKSDAALRKCRRGRKEKHRKEFERLRDDFNARSTLARDAFMQTKISHALNNNTNGFPEPWRESLLVALKKSAAPSAPTDFRPIALLCFLSKVLEKIVHDQIQGTLKSKIY